MADFTVPNYSDLIDNLNSQIAAGPPKVDFSGLERLPQSYYTGQKNQYDQRLRNIFSGGVPTTQDGSPDYTAMSKSLLQQGGASEVPNSISLGNAGLGRQILGATGVLPPSGSNMQPGATYQGGSPASNAIASQESADSKNPYSAIGPLTKDGDRAFGKYQVKGENVGPWTKEVLGQEMTPREFLQNQDAQEAVFKTKFGQYSQKYGPEGAARAWFAGEGNMNNPNASDGYHTVAQYSRGFLNAGGANGAQSDPVQQNPQTQAPFAQPSPTPTQNVPNQPTETLANAYEARANYFYQQEKGLAFVNKDAAAAAKAQGDQATAQALAIRKSLLESSTPTSGMKDANASGVGSPLEYDSAKEANKQDNDAFQKRYTGLQSLGEQSYNGIQKAQLMKNLTLDPNFYSGPLNKEVQTYHQFKAIFGSNPSSALPTEAFNKVANDMLTEQVKAMGQSGVGRVLQSEVNIMKQAIASLGITPQSNRALAEIVSRVYQQNQDIAEMARGIKAQPGQKNNALDGGISQYLKAHPLFSQQEIQHPNTLGAPDAPPQSVQWSPQQKRQWAQGIGLKPGDPIRFNGQVVSVP